MEGRARPADELLEVDVELAIEPALVDRAAPRAAGRVAERLADVGQAERNSPLLERRGQAPKVAERPERRRDRGRRFLRRRLVRGLGLSGLLGPSAAPRGSFADWARPGPDDATPRASANAPVRNRRVIAISPTRFKAAAAGV